MRTDAKCEIDYNVVVVANDDDDDDDTDNQVDVV